MKPSIPKGTRDFSPEEVLKRNYIINHIKTAFATFGFQPIETPSFENSETLMGKYGEEGDRLIFKILDSGEYFKDLKKKFSSISELLDGLNRYTNNLIRNKNNISDYLFLDIEKWVHNSENKEILKKFISIFQNEIMRYLNMTGNVSEKEIESGIRFKVNELFVNYYLENIALNEKLSISLISGKALRYDLTVPFARYVVQHQNEITFPFKRYQIQPVWRADRPQKGRFREFFQCDADVVGSNSLWQEVELVQLYDTVFSKLKLEGTTIKINNRKILSGIAEVIGAEDKLIDFTVALDKLDKIGEEGVTKEMLAKGISEKAISALKPLFSLKGNANEKLRELKKMLSTSEIGLQGISELSFITETITSLGLQSSVLEIDATLARGLNYYTGAIFEVAAPKNVSMGSIGGGGRYDDLTGIFGLKNVSGVGISFGLDRIYLVLEELGLFPETVAENTKVLFINFGEKEALYAMKAISKLRLQGIAAELYPDAAKMAKQMGYTDKRKIPFVVLAGEKEMEEGLFTLKNMQSGEQQRLGFEELIGKL